MQLDWLLQIESRPYTLNTHYYADYKDKFLSFYRGSRKTGSSAGLVQNLQSYDPDDSGDDAFQEAVTEIMSALPQLGITGTQAIDLTKLLPSDPMEPALAIMAGVRAYFQGEPDCIFSSPGTYSNDLISRLQTIHRQCAAGDRSRADQRI